MKEICNPSAALFLFLINIPAFLQSQCLTPPAGLVSWWPGDGNANDIQGNNNGTLQNGASFGVGLVGQAFSFDGVDDNVKVASFNPVLRDNGSFCFWIKLDRLPGINVRVLSRRWGSDEIYLTSGGTVRTNGSFVSGDNLISSAPIPVGQWTHVAITATPSGSSLYINGVLDDAGGASRFELDSLRIGGQLTNRWEVVPGLIDELAIFNHALSAGEIQAIFAAGSAGMCKEDGGGGGGGSQEGELAFDDGSFENFFGFTDGTGVQANGPFIPSSYPVTLTQARFLTNGSQEGTEVNINVYLDPTGAADRPATELLAGAVRATIGPGGVFQSVDLNSLGITIIRGNFFIGVESLGLDGQTNIGLGQDLNTTSANKSWTDGNSDGIFAPVTPDGVYAIRAVISSSGGGMQENELLFDDGDFELIVGFTSGFGIMANGPFSPPEYPATLTQVRFLTSGAQEGTDVNILIYLDPTGTADRPSADMLAGSVRTTIGPGGVFQSVDLGSLGITLNSGNFFVGVESLGQGNIRLGFDTTTVTNKSWNDGDLDGIFEPAVVSFQGRILAGTYAIRAVVRASGGGGPGTIIAQSTFDTDDEGWMVTSDATPRPTPQYFASGGNPGGYIGAADAGLGVYWRYIAPAAFTGDKSSAYGGTLTFDLRIPGGGSMDRAGVILVSSNGTTLGYNLDVPGTTWTRYTVPLSEAGWHMGASTSGNPVTENDIRMVLSTLVNLQILGEWQSSPDRSELDNVFLSPPSGGGGDNAPIFPTTENSLFAGTEFWVDIKVGNSNNPVTNLFGVSFELDFTQTGFIDVVTPASSNVVPGPFLGNNPVFVQNVDESAGTIGIGVSRRAGDGGVNGNGTVARIRFISRQNTPDGTQVNFSISGISAIDPGGTLIPLFASSFSVTINSGVLVWPGDTNNDGVVNQADVLPIGLCWNQTGPPRQNASTVWAGQAATPWTQQNCTYADANGSGSVNQADILPIGLNWNRMHSTTSVAKIASARSNSIESTISMGIDGSPGPGQMFWVEFMVSDVADLFGISFEFNYSPASLFIPLAVEPGSFMGDDVVFISNEDTQTGKIGIGVSRKAGQSGVNGAGIVARVQMQMSEGATLEDTALLVLQNIIANDSSGNAIEFGVQDLLVTDVVEVGSSELGLGQNYPNPFHTETRIGFHLPESTHVRLEIFDIQGQKIATLFDEKKPAGYYTTTWNGQNENLERAAPGVYIYHLVTDQFQQSRRMVLNRY